MRLTTLMLIAAILQVSASSFAQRITLSEKNTPLFTVFEKISAQSGYDFMFSSSTLNTAKKVSLNIKNVPLKDALKQIFEGQPLVYVIEAKSVVVSKKEADLKENLIGRPSNIDIHGKVLDENGKPLPGATVLVKGSKNYTQTNNSGEFLLKDLADQAILVISFIGYKSKEIEAASVSPAKAIVMQSDPSKLNEVTVISTGYQNIPVERATGAFSTVTAAKLENKLRPDLKAALEGQVPGMVVTKEGNVEIRGVSTFQGERTPLIIVDGFPLTGTSLSPDGVQVPTGLESLNIDNIESVTVLKDAVAASIYGARSSNGVIVITTKSAKGGKLAIDYRGSTGITLKPDLKYLNRSRTEDYVDAEVDVYALNPNTALNAYNNNAALTRVQYILVARDLGLMTAASANAEIELLKKNDGLQQVQDHVLQHNFMQQHNLSFTGGNEKSQSNAALKYIDSRSNIKNGKDNRLIFDMKNDWKLSNRLSVKLLTNANYVTSSRPGRTLSDFVNFTPPLATAANTRPYDLIVDPATGLPQDIFQVNPKKISAYQAIDGLKPLNFNPIEDLDLESVRQKSLQVRLGGNVNLKLIDGLSADLGGSWTLGYNTASTLYNSEAFRLRQWFDDSRSKTNPSKFYIPNGDYLNESRNTNEAYTIRAQLNLDRQIGTKHQLSAILGGEINRDVFNNNAFPTRLGYNPLAGTFAQFNYDDYISGVYTTDMLGGATGSRPTEPVMTIGNMALRDNRFVSVYANSSYEFDNRFVLSGSIRMDLANFFGTDPKFRYKPIWSVGGVYKLGQEKFMKISWLDKLNVRSTYGINGNISLRQGPFLVTSPGVYSQSTGANSASIVTPPNSTLRWEKTSTVNLGLDIGLFRRLRITADYYRRMSTDLLAPETYDPTLGVSLITGLTRNIGKLKNTGLELLVEADVIRNESFSWTTSATLSFNVNKVLEYNFNFTGPVQLAASGSVYKEGYPIDAQFSYRFAGLNANGNGTYFTKDGNVVLGSNTKIDDLVFSGTLRPKYVTAITNSFRYHAFDLSFMLIAKFGNVLRRDAFGGSNYQNRYVAERWRVPGDELTTIYPKLTQGLSGDMAYFPFADVLVESANYMKLRDLTLSYDLNKKAVSRLGMSAIKLYLQGRNLLLVTANSDKRDPETSEMNQTLGRNAFTEQGFTSLPLRPEFYAGISIKF
ncbi:SusC/RagA family TonB-linked outer membrane protein [Pedobacter gandavensis]|uniref:SusC/RagA family TonB-linked outer membrane protein n=1 Tax=Pedobacter gandavensis TaxID=2679963 RepID=UPI00292EF67A|nr:SusC/RagA family TonB-linked outer membrane protein [Pedobacter gandavensis]